MISLKLKKLINFIPYSFLYLAGAFISMIILIALWRVAFLISLSDQLSISEFFLYLKAFYIALRLDGVITAYLVAPISLIIFLPWIGWNSRYFKLFSLIYFGLAFTVLNTLYLIDINFYKEFGNHLNFQLFQPCVRQHDTIEFFLKEYPVFLFLFIIILTSFVAIFSFRKIYFKVKNHDSKWWTNLLFLPITLILLVIFARGGLQQRPIDWGHAMFCKSNPANQIALNGVFLLGRSYIELHSEKKIKESLTYFNYEKAKKIANDLNETTIEHKVLYDINKNNQLKNPNVILIILESHVGAYCGYINPAMKDVTPVLDSLAHNGIGFTRCFGNGRRSAHGIGSILCSYPVLPGFPIISQIEAQRNMKTGGSVFKEYGYETTFLYGGDADFDNMKGFLKSNGFDNIIEEAAFTEGTPGTMWGVYDHYAFDKLLSLMDNGKGRKQFISLFTTTNHQPWEVPPSYESIVPQFTKKDVERPKTLRTMNYVDLAIKEFMKKARLRDWFENTVFLFISDHGLRIFHDMPEDPRNGHIAFVIYSPAYINNPVIIPNIVSQVDLLPTLLHLINKKPEPEFLGRNMIVDKTGFACRVSNDNCIWIEKNSIYYEVLNQNNYLFKYNDIYEYPYQEIPKSDSLFSIMQTRFRGYIQSAYFNFKDKIVKN